MRRQDQMAAASQMPVNITSLVAKDTVLDVFISDAADKPVPPAGFKALAILVVDGKSQRISLEPFENKR